MSLHDEAMKELEKLADYYGNDVEDWKIGIYIKQQEQLQAEHEAFKRDVQKLMYYFEYKEKWTNELEESLKFYYYKVLNKVGKL